MLNRPVAIKSQTDRQRHVGTDVSLVGLAATLGGALGRLQRVDLGGSGNRGLHVRGKVATASSPLFGRDRVAGAELFAFKFAHAVTARTLFNHRGKNKTVDHHAFSGFGGFFQRGHSKTSMRSSAVLLK
ncbi:hypothetical protein KM92DES2_12388 [uncultured Desulfovibrio sp.]|uniref:Uncharacterized protein n=1 Tax=uncultured Desulfovibrio sp. TaxID=167968 RepID=A0A212K853_9BACT|nr:hypothetical protein KM92DES2_12388 [uncultured Desulfovibrio sp.]